MELSFSLHIVKSFSIVNKAKVYVFLEFSCFFYDPTDVGNLISGSSAFFNSSVNIWSSQFTYCWSLAWRILSITLLACEMSASTATLSAPDPAAGHCQLMPPLETPGHSQEKLGQSLGSVSLWWSWWYDHSPRARHSGMQSQVGLRKHHYKQS